MNFKKKVLKRIDSFEKALMQPCFQCLIELKHLHSKHENKNKNIKGTIYTAYSLRDLTIKIGFASQGSNEETLLKDHELKIVAKKPGTLQHKSRIKETLKELGYNPKYGNEYFEYSTALIRHLEMLLWPVGDLYQR